MESQYKYALLRALEKLGVVRESVPSVESWHFIVLKPEELPDVLRAEYQQYSEIRWA